MDGIVNRLTGVKCGIGIRFAGAISTEFITVTELAVSRNGSRDCCSLALFSQFIPTLHQDSGSGRIDPSLPRKAAPHGHPVASKSEANE